MHWLLLSFLLPVVLTGKKEANISKAIVTLHPPWVNVLKNDHVTLRCNESDTQEENSIHWFHNGKKIPVQNQDYRITDSKLTDSGAYQCQIGQSALSDPVSLEVSEDWLLLQTLKFVYKEGENMKLRCHSWKNKTFSKFIFYHNDDGTYSPQNPNFSKNQVKYNDNGDYRCTAIMGDKTYTSKVVRITVEAANKSSKVWYQIPFYLVMGILFAADTGLYFILKRELGSQKKTIMRRKQKALGT